MISKLKIWIKTYCFDKNGKFQGRLLYLKKNSEEYKQIMDFLDDSFSIPEKIYHIMNDLYEPINFCIHCKNKTKFVNYTKGYSRFCSTKCSSNNVLVKNKVKQTNKKKYGIEHSFQSDIIKKKIKQTNKEKYGFENPFQSEIIKKKIKQTNKEKYNVEYPIQSDVIKKKIKKTNKEKYNVEYPMQSDVIKNKAILSIKKSYMDGKRTLKVEETCLKKYGVKNISQKHLLEKKILNKVNSILWLKNQNNELKKSCRQISKELEINDTSVAYFMNKYNIKINNCKNSHYEKEIIDFLNIENIEINNRSIIPPYELDIYIPDYKLAIEFNGLYWHSNKDKNYHLNKTQMCLEKGIQLFHMFENEWIDSTKRDIWKSIINNKLGRNNKIFARKCEIKEIDNNLAREFLDNNHLQGFTNSSIKLGLFYDNELMSLMTFGKTRFSRKYEWEMIRFCNKKFFTVIGGASKLYRYFVNNYKPSSIISYADRRYSNGGLYKKLGFEFSHYSKPNYWYFKLPDITLLNRLKFQKYKLKNLIENFNENKSELENMINNGYKRIFDCGNIIYTKKRSLIN